MLNKILYFICLSVFIAGCSPESAKAPGTYVGDKTCIMSDLASDDVVLVVNGEEFTKHDFLVVSALYDKINRLRAGLPLVGHDKKAEYFVKATRPLALSDLLRRALMRQYAEKHNIEPSSELVSAAEQRLVKAMRRPKATIKEIADLFGGDEGRLLIEYNRGDALDEAVRRHFDTGKTLELTDDDIMAVSNQWRSAQAEAALSNKVQRTALEKAIEEIKGGADFAAVAEKYSERPDESQEWDDFLLEEFEESPQVAEWLKTAKTGDVSGILEMDDGWSVIKVLSRHKEEFAPEGISEQRDMWLLVRISKTLYETAEDMPRSEIVRQLTMDRSRELQKKVGAAVMADAVIQWPFGTNLFPRVTNPGIRPPRPGKKGVKVKR